VQHIGKSKTYEFSNHQIFKLTHRMFTIMDDDGNVSMVEEPSADYGYTYADYLTWKFEERLELFRGKIFKMSGANTKHQVVQGNLHLSIGNYLKKQKKCRVFMPPYDVRLPAHNRKKDHEITTVVQPDLCVICDPSRIDDRGILGAPDLVIEILSSGNSKKELRLKYELYEEAGVKEYRVVFPAEEAVLIYYLTPSGFFSDAKTHTAGDVINVKTIPGLSIDVSDIFDN
jgi:Uma2 family endonuclease